MKNKWILSSAIIQGVYSVFCLLNIALCLIYKGTHATEMGSLCASIALNLTGILSIVPAMPISLFFHICARPQTDNALIRRRWLTQTVFSPILYVILWGIMIIVFVATTGGI